MEKEQKPREKRYLVACMAFVLAILYTMPGIHGKAAGGLKLNASSLSLYVGNDFQLEITEGYEPQDGGNYDDWWFWWDVPYYSSSDASIVQVDQNGMLHAVGVGTATITVGYDGMSATCKVKVKANSCKISAKELTLYEGQSATVSLSYSKKKAVSYNACIYRADTWQKYADNYYSYDIRVAEEGKGKFTIYGNKSGDYYVELILNAADGKSYSALCLVHVEGVGLTNSDLAVAVGKSKQLSVENAENVTYESTNKSIVTVSSKGKAKGISAGEASIKVTYTAPNGEEKQEYCCLYVTDPVYVPMQGALILGNSYWPEFEGIAGYYSTMEMSSSDPSVLYVYGNYARASGVGTATLTMTVDGVKFKQEIKVIDPKLSANYAMLVKGKTKTLKVTGADVGSVITYSSSDTSVAKVSKTGKITAVGAGSARIAAQVDGTTLYCSVTVVASATNGVKAVQKGEKVLGAAYDQNKRMQPGYYDCSSFVWRSYNEAGLQLGGFSYAPTAAELAKKLESQGKAIAYEYIPASELKPGDLIFYGGGSNGRYKNIYHVAMYYGSDLYEDYWTGGVYDGGLIIHASGTVHIRSYSGYIPGAIVMIARPYGK